MDKTASAPFRKQVYSIDVFYEQAAGHFYGISLEDSNKSFGTKRPAL